MVYSYSNSEGDGEVQVKKEDYLLSNELPIWAADSNRSFLVN